VAGRVLGKRWSARWALGSLLLHALLLGFAALSPRLHAKLAVTAPLDQSPTEIDVVLDAAPVELAAVPAPEQASVEPGHIRAGAALHGAAPMAEAEADVEATPGAAEESSEATPAAPAGSSSASAPHLSLAALGVDGGNPFLDRGDPAAARAAKAARVKRRLDRALAQGLTNSDVALGRGAGGPVLRAFEAATYASTVPLNGSASFVLVIDSEGKLVSSVLGNASGDREAWARVARQTAQALAQRKLQVPRGKSVQLAIEVTSHLELPSGADPGLELSAQGIPLKKGGGPRSTKLDISIFPFPAATLAGDPADIGARARRMVHAHVVSEELL
jgi:hypothetical protein